MYIKSFAACCQNRVDTDISLLRLAYPAGARRAAGAAHSVAAGLDMSCAGASPGQETGVARTPPDRVRLRPQISLFCSSVRTVRRADGRLQATRMLLMSSMRCSAAVTDCIISSRVCAFQAVAIPSSPSPS